MNKRQFEKFVDNFEWLQERLDEIWSQMRKIDDEYVKQLPDMRSERKGGISNIESIDVHSIGFMWEDSWRYGGYERGYDSIKTDYLFDKDWEKKYRELYEKKLRAHKMNEAKKAEKRKIEKEQRDREEYERLKEKFEKGNK